MLKRVVTLSGLVAAVNVAGAYPLKQVSRYSWFTNVGWYDFHASGQTPIHRDWNISDSTNAFGYWTANIAGSVYYGGEQTSIADPYRAWIFAQVADDSFLGNQSSWSYHLTTGFVYVFDVVVPLKVRLSGIGMKLTSPSGFSYTQPSFGSGTVEKNLPVGRYTFETQSTSGSMYATSELVVLSCPNDLTGDNLVDDADFVAFCRAYELKNCANAGMGWSCLADLNGDKSVDDADFVLFVTGYDAMLCP